MKELVDVLLTADSKPEFGGLSHDGYIEHLLTDVGLATALVIEPPAPGGPCYVVTRESVDAVAAVLFSYSVADTGFRDMVFGDRTESGKERWREQAMSVLAALLGPGKLRVAKAVGVRDEGPPDGFPSIVNADGSREWLTGGEVFALLEDKA